MPPSIFEPHRIHHAPTGAPPSHPGPVDLAELLSVLDQCSAPSLWEFIKLAQFMRVTGGNTVGPDALMCWLNTNLVDNDERPLLAPHHIRRNRHLAHKLMTACIRRAPAHTQATWFATLLCRAKQVFLHAVPLETVSCDKFDRAIDALAAGFQLHRLGEPCDPMDEAVSVFVEATALAPQRDIAAIYTELDILSTGHDETHTFLPEQGYPSCRASPRAGLSARPAPRPDIASRLQRDDIRLACQAPKRPRGHASVRQSEPVVITMTIRFPSEPVREVDVPLPAHLAAHFMHRYDHTFSMLSDRHFDAVTAALEPLTECEAVFEEDRIQAKRYEEFAARYCFRAPRKKTPKIPYSYFLSLVLLPFLKVSMSEKFAHDARDNTSPGTAGRIREIASAADFQLSPDVIAYPRDQSPGASSGSWSNTLSNALSNWCSGWINTLDTWTKLPLAAAARPRVPIHLWEHTAAPHRRRILHAAKTFALSEGNGLSGGVNYRGIQQINDDGWYAYSQIPHVFLLCDKLLDDVSHVDEVQFDRLIGLIGLETDASDHSPTVCFENIDNTTITWTIDASPHSVNYGLPAHIHRRKTRGAASAISQRERKAALEEIIRLQLQANDPPISLTNLIFNLRIAKHDIETHPERQRSAAEVRHFLRANCMLSLVENNRREFPEKIVYPEHVTTPGAVKFVDFLIDSFDSVLRHAPDDSNYFGADFLRARFGDYFSLKLQQEGVTGQNWHRMVEKGAKHVEAWTILTFDSEYMEAMIKENAEFVQRMRTLFATDLARTAWLYHDIKVGRLLPRADLARRHLLNAGINPDERLVFRPRITLDEAYQPGAAVRDMNNETLLDLYLTVNDGLRKLRATEPRYMARLSDATLNNLPSRQDVMAEFDTAFTERVAYRRTSFLLAIHQAYEALPAETRRLFNQTSRLKLHLWRPLEEETTFLAEHLEKLGVSKIAPLTRKVMGFHTGAMIEIVDARGDARYFLFAPERFVRKYESDILVELPYVQDQHELEAFMEDHAEVFFTEQPAGNFEEDIYYKNDITQHLIYECSHLDALWRRWIDARLSHLSWHKKQLASVSYVESLQETPSELYVNLLPFYSCWTLSRTPTLTEGHLVDSLFCLLDLSLLSYAPRAGSAWISQTMAMSRVKQQLARYQRLAQQTVPMSNAIQKQILELEQIKAALNLSRRQHSFDEAMEVSRSLSPFPWAKATSYSLAEAVQEVSANIYTISTKVSPLMESRVETPQAKQLRLLMSVDYNQRINNTLFGELRVLDTYRSVAKHMRLSDQRSRRMRMRPRFCVPGQCVPLCTITSLDQLPRHKRERTIMDMIKGHSLDKVSTRALAQGYRYTPALQSTLRHLDRLLVPMRRMYQTALREELAHVDQGQHILWLALKERRGVRESNATRSAVRALRARPNYQYLEMGWNIIKTVTAPKIDRLIMLDLNALPVSPHLRWNRIDLDLDVDEPIHAVHANTSTSETRVDTDDRCVRPAEHREIRTCTLPIAFCMTQRAFPENTAVDDTDMPVQMTPATTG